VGAYGGDIAGARLAELREEGWLLCDGQGYPPRDDYAGLFGVIGYLFGVDGRENFRVPDLRGVFVRGADHGRHTDPDAGERSTGDKVGSMQGYATGLPIKVFVTGATDDQPVGHVVRRSTTAAPKAAFGTSTDGNHNHSLNHVPGEHYTSDYCAGHHVTAWNAGSTAIDRAGTHGHSFNSGGDHETRPINLALDFIIRFQGA
jgi:microcystin-dependent protein